MAIQTNTVELWVSIAILRADTASIKAAAALDIEARFRRTNARRCNKGGSRPVQRQDLGEDRIQIRMPQAEAF